MLSVKLRQHLYFLRARLPLKRNTEGELQSRIGLLTTFAHHTRREGAGRFDVNRIVQQHQGLLRRVRLVASHGAFLARRSVEGEHAWMQERAAPERIKPASKQVLSLVILPFAFGEIQVLPVTRRLIRFDAGATDLAR